MLTIQTNDRPTRGFSLIELLVVVAIIAILATFGVSASTGALERVQATKCLSSMRQIGTAIQLYVADNNGGLPDTSHMRATDGSSLSWTTTLSAYLTTNFIGRCPANKDALVPVTYAWNDLLTSPNGAGISVLMCANPSATMIVGETADSYISEHFHFSQSRTRVTYNQFRRDVSVDRHNTYANYLFVDGHVESLAPSDVRARLAPTTSKFLQPTNSL